MRIKDFAQKTLCYGNQDLTIAEIIKQWIKEKQNIYIVTDKKQEKILGIVTLYDVLKKITPFYLKIDDLLINPLTESFLDNKKIKRILALKAEEIMTRNPITIKEEDSLIKAMAIMYNKNFDYLPVIDKENKFTKKILTRFVVEDALLKIASN